MPLITRPAVGDEEPEVLVDGRVRPASLVFDPQGQITARFDKMHLFDVEVSDKQARYAESDSFEAGDKVVAVDTAVARVGLTVCYDLRFPELYRRLFNERVELISVPAAFTRVTGEAHWEVLLRARAIENQCYIIGAGQGGVHNEKRETFGHSMIVDPWGRVLDVLACGEGTVVADIELDQLHELRRKMPVFSHRRL
jgi:nitrilase